MANLNQRIVLVSFLMRVALRRKGKHHAKLAKQDSPHKKGGFTGANISLIRDITLSSAALAH